MTPDPPRPASDRSTLSHGAGLLERWLQNPLDEGYAEAAARRAAAARSAGEDPGSGGPVEAGPGDDARGRALWPITAPRAWTAIGCVLIGAVLMIAYLVANRDAPTDARTRADLRGRVKQAETDGSALASKAQSLDAQVAGARAAALGTGSNSALTMAEAQAGTVAVHGPGVTVVLGNRAAPSAAATGRAGTTPLAADSVLTDTDVRSIVNELWLDGAEAIAVDDIRLTPTSAIRFAGQAVLVDFQPVTSPYKIDAIGDSNQLITAFTDSVTASRYRTLASVDRFTFHADTADRLTLAPNVVTGPRYASIPVPTPTPTATPTSTVPPTPTTAVSTPSVGSS